MTENPQAGNQFGDIPPLPPAPKTVTALDVAGMQGPRTAHNLNSEGVRNTLNKPNAPPSAEEKKAGGEITAENNPASPAATIFGVTRESRVSMNTPNRKLETPELPGYHLHWFLRTNVPPAIRAGYEFVDVKELPSMDKSIGGRGAGSNTADLGGSQITHYDSLDAQGNTVDLVLMKIRQEWYFDDQRLIAERNLSVLQMIFHKRTPIRQDGESNADFNQRYTKEAVIDMSNGRFRKA